MRHSGKLCFLFKKKEKSASLACRLAIREKRGDFNRSHERDSHLRHCHESRESGENDEIYPKEPSEEGEVRSNCRAEM